MSTRTPTLVHPTPTLPFPIRITLLLTPPNTHINRGTNILYYEYSSHGVELEGAAKKGERRTGAWECPVEGEVVKWLVAKGDVVRDASKPIVEILEPCRHEEQVNGLCLICLKDVSGTDYTGFSDTSRATVAMVHDAASITVSPEVAARLEQENQARLLASRKLSLVVDLDQTIIQATVDPTVGEWIEQGRAWEEGREGARRNPNWEALRDVGSFKLSEERKLANAGNGRAGKIVQRGRREDTTYYIKPRPGLHAFLTRLSQLYEMHVYTMGTRSYASAVVKLIDPTGAFFGSRVLSRDESGSLTFKSLTRLFPCNTGSAVIIDDRADVWELSRANLVKVVPYDFFSVGDINGTFLPPQPASLPGTPNSTTSSGAVPIPAPSPSATAVSSSSETAEPAGADLIPTVALAQEEAEETEKEEKAKLAMERLQEQKIERDRESRPLARLQEELEARERERSERGRSPGSPGSPGGSVAGAGAGGGRRSRAGSENGSVSRDGRGSRGSSPERAADAQMEDTPAAASENGEGKEASGAETNGHSPAPAEGSESPAPTAVAGNEPEDEPMERALLTNDDHELERVQRILEEIHRRYFAQYDLYLADKTHRKEPSVMEIIPEMKASVLAGVHLVFSSLIPIDTAPQATDLWRQALQFGASCYTRVTREVTHVVAAKRGTEKVRQALARRGKVWIVNPYWFLDSVAAWERKREEDYPLEGLEQLPAGIKPVDDPPEEGGEGEGPGTVTHPASPGLNGKDDSGPPSPLGSGDAQGDGTAPAEGVDGEGTADEDAEVEDLGDDVDLGELDWNEMDAELEDLMDEEDGDEGDDDGEEDGAEVDYPDDPDADVEADDAPRGKKRRRGDGGSALPTPRGSDDEGDGGVGPPLGAKRPRRGSLVERANEVIIEASQVPEDEVSNGHDAADDEDDEDLDDFLARDLQGMDDEVEDGDEDGEGAVE